MISYLLGKKKESNFDISLQCKSNTNSSQTKDLWNASYTKVQKNPRSWDD